MKKKILFISHSSVLAGGAEDDFVRVMEHFSLLNDRYEIHGLFPEGPRKLHYAKYCSKWGVYKWGFCPVINENLAEYFKYFLKFFIQAYQVLKFTHKVYYDLCIINVAVLLWPALMMKLKKTKVIFFIKEEIYPKFLRHLIYRFISKVGIYFIPNSETKKRDFIKKTNNLNITTIYSAVEENKSYDLSLTNFIDENLYLKLKSKEFFKIVSVGGIFKRKNQMLLLGSINLLKKSNIILPNIFFIGKVYNGSHYVKKINKYIIDNNLNLNCYFLDEIERSVLYEIYKHIDLTIISSFSEGIPLTLVESFRFKVPVISTKVGGIPEIVSHGVNGLLIDFNYNSLAEAILKIMSDKKLTNLLVENAYKTYQEKFNLKKSLSKTEEIFEKIINE